MLDIILKILLLVLILLAFLVLYYVFEKLSGVDLKKLQSDVKAIKDVVYTPIESCDDCLLSCKYQNNIKEKNENDNSN